MERPHHHAEKSTDIKRKIGLVTATSIVVANMIGAGIFTTSGILAGYLPGPPWVLLCWLAGGLLAMCGALCYAELATRMPEEGGEYIYLKTLYHPLFGFLTGWTSFFVGFSAPIAASALGAVSYIYQGLQANIPGFNPAFTRLYIKLSASVIIAVFTTVHYLGVRYGSIVQNILTGFKIIVVTGLVLLGLLSGSNWSNLFADSRQGFNGEAFGFLSGVGGLTLGTAMMLVMFAYSGWNASAYIAGEIKNPHRNLPLSLILGTALVILIYLILNLFIFMAVPYSELSGQITVFETAMKTVLGEGIGRILSILIGFALLSSLSAFIILGPRVYFAMSRDRLFFSFAAKIHPRYEVPGRSIVIQGSIAIVLLLIGTFEQLLIYLGFALSIFPWMAVLGIFIARKRHINSATMVATWGYPVTPLIYLAGSMGLMIVVFFNRPLESLAALLTVAGGIPVYYLWTKYKLFLPAAEKNESP
jgi:APA family basic amino acid/polyamine antiporter